MVPLQAIRVYTLGMFHGYITVLECAHSTKISLLVGCFSPGGAKNNQQKSKVP
jgi:hypothetical protein